MFKKFLQYEKLPSENEQKNLLDLGSKISQFSADLELNEDLRERMRANLLSNLAEGKTDLPIALQRIGNKLKELGASEFLTSKQKYLLLSELKNNHLVKTAPGWTWAYRSVKTALASFLIVVLSMTFFIISPFELRLTKAAKWSFLENVRGEVYVNRDGKILYVDKDFVLEQGDLIFTRSNSFVVIRFLDDSITRLGENTSLEIKKLYAKPDNLVNTQVELSLVGGQIWASVYDLVDNESKFVVETENALAKVHSKAAFELKSKDQSTSLAVFTNVVDFSRKSDTVEQVQPVVSGFKAEINTQNTFQIDYNNHDLVVKKNLEGVDDWVKMNMEMDAKHEVTLKEENKQFIADAVDKDSSLSGALADFKDSTKLIFNSANIEKARVKFINAHLDFIKAQQILNEAKNNEERRKALTLIWSYKNAVKDIMTDYNSLKAEDAVQAEQLFQEMKEEVDAQRKALSIVMPTELLYTAKFAINDVAANFAIDDGEKAQYLLAKARDRLYEAQALININDLKGAEASFNSYLTDLDDLVQQVSIVKAAEVESSMFDLIDEQIKQFKVLNAIEKKLIENKDERLLVLVQRVNSNNLEKLISIFKTYREKGIPFVRLSELNNTIKNYFDDGAEKQAALKAMNDLMKIYPEYLSLEEEKFPKQEDITPDAPLIVDFEATKDINANL